jgi:hypothetical protein
VSSTEGDTVEVFNKYVQEGIYEIKSPKHVVLLHGTFQRFMTLARMHLKVIHGNNRDDLYYHLNDDQDMSIFKYIADDEKTLEEILVFYFMMLVNNK